MWLRSALLLIAGFIIPAAILGSRPTATPLKASDHADTAGNYNRPGADLADLYIFPSPTNANNVVLAMNVHPLIPAGQGMTTPFDPQVLYQFKIDVTGDAVEDLVLQARFTGTTAATQQVFISGPARPLMTGAVTLFGRPNPTVGTLNKTFTTTNGMTVFAGGRSDPFFFDLSQFFALFPDRATPMEGFQDDRFTIQQANTPQLNSFRGFPPNNFGGDTTPAQDLLLNFNVLSIVVEMPRAMLGSGPIAVWMTTSLPNPNSPFQFMQQDRLARPAVNEALSTVTLSRHDMNNKLLPTDDPNPGHIYGDIVNYMTNPLGAGRSTAIANALASVLTPDVMKADLSKTGAATYLGVETGGFTGGLFGGRALPNDVIDIDLMAIFGPVIPALGLTPDDGQEKPRYATDNIGPHADYQIGGLQPNGTPYPPAAFPYLGNPK